MMNSFTPPLKPVTESALQSGLPDPEIGQTEIRIKGKPEFVPSVQINGRTVITNRKWLSTALVFDEDILNGDIVAEPMSFIEQLRKSDIRADLFTFPQKFPDVTPRFPYHLEWDNIAVIPITTYPAWEKRVESSVRRAVRKAAKEGLVVKVVDFNDEFVHGICAINNETPIRQGRPFWHYQKSFDEVKQENSTYADRNIFIGAYVGEELIGFIRMTRIDGYANLIQQISKIKYYEKRPGNAMLAKAVEVCAERGITHLQYCNYVYNDPSSSLTEFKRRNGFEKVLVPRYYVPLTAKGKIALGLGLHRGLVQRIPKPLLTKLLHLRNKWYERKIQKQAD
jgi:hypothetical protein